MKIDREFFKTKKFIVCSAITAIAILIAITYALGYKVAMGRFNKVISEVNERQAMYAKLSEVDQVVRQNYLGTIDEDILKESMCEGYISGIKGYVAEYLDASSYKNYSEHQSGKYIDLGIKTIQTNDNNVEVTFVEEGSPAQKAGIQKGDIIISIDSVKVSDVGYEKSILSLSKPSGNHSDIELIRNISEEPYKETKKISVTYETYQKKPVTYKMLENNTVGKITISEFSPEAVNAFDFAVSTLESESADKYILDLRNCKGEEISYAAQILDRILPDGNLISTIDKHGNKNVLYMSNSSQFQYPITVLVNSGTSGAGEIVASAIKDYQKGEVIGQTTAGNGTFKKVYPLSDGSAIIISIANYITKNEVIFTDIGVSPNKEVILSEEKRTLLDRNNLSENDDDQVQAAIESLGGITWSKFLEMQEIAKAEQEAAESALKEAQESQKSSE